MTAGSASHMDYYDSLGDTLSALFDGHDSDEKEDDMPGNHNAHNVDPVATDTSGPIPTRYWPLCRALHRSIQPRQPWTKWSIVNDYLENTNGLANTGCMSTEEYLKEAIGARIGIVCTTDPAGQPEMIFWKLPPRWFGDEPDAAPRPMPDPARASTSHRLMLGTRNITTEVAMATLRLSPGAGQPVPATRVAHAMNEREPSMIADLVPILHARGLLLHFDENRQSLTVLRFDRSDRRKLLDKTMREFFRQLKERICPALTLQQHLWDQHPNVFLACHARDLATLIQIASGDEVPIKLSEGGTHVHWMA